MYTGIVQGLRPVLGIQSAGGVRRFEIDLGTLADDLEIGGSVAVNGVCLTATEISDGHVAFDVIPESLARSNLGSVSVGDLVNIERSMKYGTEIGGHILSGHIACTARIERIQADDGQRTLSLAIPESWMRYLMHKGFVALDGASITIATVDRARNEIGVSLIPETLARTTLGRYVVGDRVNVEVDAQTQAVVDTVERLMGDADWRRRSGLAAN